MKHADLCLAHDAEYRRSLKDWQSFVESITMKIIDADSTVPELPSKDVIFRIHRDIRFSNDPTPYKVGWPAFRLFRIITAANSPTSHTTPPHGNTNTLGL
jgi:uncharacterized protein (DUF2461 family)